MLATAGPIYPHRYAGLSDDFRDLPCAPCFGTEACQSDAAVRHLDFLAVFDDPIRFAFEAKALDWTGGHASWSGATFKEVLSKNEEVWCFNPSFASETRYSCDVAQLWPEKRGTASQGWIAGVLIVQGLVIRA